MATKKAVRAVRGPKRDESPDWTDADKWTPEEFNMAFRKAMNFYRLESNEKDPKSKVIDWMGRNGYDRDTIKQFKKTKDWRTSLTMYAVASCLMRGMPAVKKGFNGDKNSDLWLRKSISKVIHDGHNDIAPEDSQPKDQKVSAVVNIQDRIREQAVEMCDKIDEAIDNWILNPDSFDPKEFKMTNLLRSKGCKSAQARYIKSFYEREFSDLQELASGKADEQLKEAYSHASRRNVKKLIEFYELINSACEQIAAESKVLKKPRIKKTKPAEELVKKIKFKISDDKLGVSSVPPAGIIGAQMVAVYNTKNRKFGIYHSKTSEGLSVKGASIAGFTDMSMQKTLRKPESQIKEFKTLNTQKRVEDWFNKSIKTTAIALNGRINQDILILKIFK